ncbi:MAG: helix-turn-helix transcriptional regulator [Clostridia bacterium]
MQTNRLFEMVYLLLERKTMTAKELAQRFEVSTRTIYRDVEVLSSANIPIYCSKGKGGGIHLLENFVLDKSILSETEQNQILFALQSLEKLKASDEHQTLDKMHRIFKKQSKDWIQIDFSSWGTSKEKDTTFAIIKEAILNCQVITFTYYNTYGQQKQRTVEPLQIWFKDKAWYLKAYCREKQDYRIFKIARMKHITKQEETFERTLPKQPEKSWEIKTVLLKLQIDKKMAYRIYDEFEESQIQVLENGNFYITVEYPENDWIYGYILSFGEYIQVIEPEYIKEEIKRQLQKTLENYKE